MKRHPRIAKTRAEMSPEERSCTSKVSFVSEGAARIGATRILYAPSCRTKRMWVYPCKFCPGWHLTSSPSGHGVEVVV